MGGNGTLMLFRSSIFTAQSEECYLPPLVFRGRAGVGVFPGAPTLTLPLSTVRLRSSQARGGKKFAFSHLLLRRGFVLLPDVMTALWIVAVLIVVLSISLGAQRRAERRLNDQLLALRGAESALTQLQQHSAPIKFASNVLITPVSPGWSRVTVTINRASATLVGPTETTP